MKFSTKVRYGIRAMLELAENYGTGPLPLKNIAQRQNISENYLEQLFSLLKKEKLIKSVRGAQGGYFLARGPGEITIGNIYRALEGPLEIVFCVSENQKEVCKNKDYCLTRDIWEKVRDSINDIFDNTTLAQLLENAKNKMQ